MRMKATTGLLAAIVVLLGLNFVVGGSTPAQALDAGVGEVTLVDVDFRETEYIWRFFSDGTVDVTNFNIDDASCLPDPSPCRDPGPYVILPPVMAPGSPGPRVVGGRVAELGVDHGPELVRYWSDGSVDATAMPLFHSATGYCLPEPSNCPNPGTFQIIGPAPYPACAPFDTNLDGEVGINDFLDLLAAWGACP